MAREQLGFNREELAANVGLKKERIELARRQLVKIGIPEAQSVIWAREKEVELAEEAHIIEREKMAQQDRQFQQQVGLERGGSGSTT